MHDYHIHHSLLARRLSDNRPFQAFFVFTSPILMYTKGGCRPDLVAPGFYADWHARWP